MLLSARRGHRFDLPLSFPVVLIRHIDGFLCSSFVVKLIIVAMAAPALAVAIRPPVVVMAA